MVLRALQNSVAAPIKNLNALLLKVESEVIELQSLYATADLQSSDGAGHKGLNKKKHKQIKDLEKRSLQAPSACWASSSKCAPARSEEDSKKTITKQTSATEASRPTSPSRSPAHLQRAG